MRTKNSIKNSLINVIQYFVLFIIGFITQKIFINILGVEYLGLNGLFNNIISMLGIVELGIGSSIIYNLYKPLTNNDKVTINSLMKFYKKAYSIIGIIVLIIGVMIMPFLGNIVTDITIDINLNIIYLLFISDIVASYFLSYKRSILYADQKNYIINVIHIIYYILLNIFQILYLYFSKDYYGYLIIKIVMRIIENLVITLYVNNKYKYLDIKNAQNLDDNILFDIKKKVKSLFFHKIGYFVVMGTDNIIISKYLGLVVLGLYSNYLLIIDALSRLFSETISAITPSVGNLLIENNSNKNYEVFKRVRFINFWIACVTSIGILVVMDNFITVWLGNKFLLEFGVLITLVFNYYQKSMRASYSVFKEAAGIFYEDRFVPLVESLLNIIFSIIFVKIFGLAGVFIGTIISGLTLWCYSYPKFVYKKLFNRNYINYIKETLGYILTFVLIAILTYVISKLIIINNNFIQLIINLIVCLIIPNILMILLFNKSAEFKYYIDLLKKILKKEEHHEKI